MPDLTRAKRIKGMLRVYDSCPEHRLLGALASYERYNRLLAEIASRTGHSLELAVGVFAALSPNNSYVSNLRNTLTMLKAERDGRSLDEFRVNTYGQNKRKAWQMARDKVPPLELFKGLKTRAFFRNCLDPLDPEEPITVDGHMYWVWEGRKGVVKHRGEARSEVAPPSLNPGLYAEIASCIRRVAALRGVVGCQAQAVLWQQWRATHNVMGASQGELLASDCIALGFTRHELATNGCGR